MPWQPLSMTVSGSFPTIAVSWLSLSVV
ncbi:hypothetical protein XAP412_1430002 [Xanthomonas phaseoli pv. phaseoli]|uniref:Uncharacterized protein n=1 Tax=Xanthomonas campestris pv. phaseoli TaxID=317013 RepID=A0AB38DXW3_XANCH|nr:hypothetical protein XAP6984_1570003 [Xanthomonas phaseoli pv. phaseoli]SON80385.1 hypothetical protein XAP412_1430002 [Xanthomonas phaseoli pv. phaseoli]SON83975.1 hypothetical protein XAP7430_1500003 [Xanthomonas phaseoli pv. phaseoli]